MRFSSRIPWAVQPSALARAVEARAPGTLDLTVSNPTDAGLAYDREEILRALASPAALRYEPAPAGLMTARAAVAGYYNGAVAPEQVVMTASTSEAYSWLFKLLCDPGDEVLAPRPSYPLFEFLSQLEGVRIVQYPMHYTHGWHVDVEALRDAVTERTRAVVFVNPNNPTGSYLKKDEYTAIAELCNQHGLALICDEVFADYELEPGGDYVRTLAGRNDCATFVLSGLSKVCGLPQLKAGWIAVQGEAWPETLARLELIADTFLSVGSPVQHALALLLANRVPIQEQISARVRRNLSTLRRVAAPSVARLLDVEGGWSSTLRVPCIRSEEEWVLRLLADFGTLVQPGYFYDFESEAYLILSLLTPSEIFEEGARRTILACEG